MLSIPSLPQSRTYTSNHLCPSEPEMSTSHLSCYISPLLHPGMHRGSVPLCSSASHLRDGPPASHFLSQLPSLGKALPFLNLSELSKLPGRALDTHYHDPLWKEELSLLPGRGVPHGHVIGFGSVSTGSSGRNVKPREDRGLLPPWLH